MADCSRRALLGTMLSCGGVGLAGCIGGSGQTDGDSQNPTDTETPTPTADTGEEQSDRTPQDDGENDTDSDPISVVDTAVVERGSGCSRREDGKTQTEINGNIVTVNGTITVQNACHEPAVDANVSGTTLSVTVSSQPTDESEVCTQCIGSLTYESTVELSRTGIERVEVTLDQYSEQNGDSPGEPTVETIETVDTDCKTESSTVSASIEDGTAIVEGIMRAPNPCHEATVTGLEYDENTLELTIDIESTDEICTECIGEIHYEANIDLDGVSPGRVSVDHVPGKSHQVDLG